MWNYGCKSRGVSRNPLKIWKNHFLHSKEASFCIVIKIQCATSWFMSCVPIFPSICFNMIPIEVISFMDTSLELQTHFHVFSWGKTRANTLVECTAIVTQMLCKRKKTLIISFQNILFSYLSCVKHLAIIHHLKNSSLVLWGEGKEKAGFGLKNTIVW